MPQIKYSISWDVQQREKPPDLVSLEINETDIQDIKVLLKNLRFPGVPGWFSW